MKRVSTKNGRQTDCASKGSAQQTKKMTKTCHWIAAAVIGAQLIAPSIMADNTADAIAALKKQIDALSAKVRQLENRLPAECTSSGVQPEANLGGPQPERPTPSRNSALSPPGRTALSGSGPCISNFTLRLQGFGQLDGHDYQSVDAGQKDTFTVRRLRAIESGTVYKDYDYYLQERTSRRWTRPRRRTTRCCRMPI